MNSQVADLVGDRDGGRASTPRSHPYPFPLPRITTAAKKPLTVEEADSFTSSCAGMTATERSENPNAIALPSMGRRDLVGGVYKMNLLRSVFLARGATRSRT